MVRRYPAFNPHPTIDEATLGALFRPAAQRSPLQAARVALDDALFAEVLAADAIVIGAPMYNFGITVQLKSWLVREKPLPLTVPTAINQCWPMDFMHDQLADRRSIRLFNVIDANIVANNLSASPVFSSTY